MTPCKMLSAYASFQFIPFRNRKKFMLLLTAQFTAKELLDSWLL